MTTLPDRLAALDPEHRLTEVWEYLGISSIQWQMDANVPHIADAALLRLLDEVERRERMLRLFIGEYMAGTEPSWYWSEGSATTAHGEALLADLARRAEEET